MAVKEERKIASLSSVFKAYWGVTKKHPYLFFGVFVSALTLQGADLAAPLFMRQFFNTLTLNHPTPATISSLILTLGFAASMWLLDWAALRAQGLFNEHLEASIMQELFKKAFTYTLDHSYNFFTSNFAGAITHKIGRFARAFETLFDAIMTQFFPTTVFVLGAITILFTRHPLLGSLLLGWAILFLTFQIILSRLRQPVRQRRAEAESNVTAALADAISNQNTISLFSGMRAESARFEAVVEKWGKATLQSWITDGWTQSAIGFLMILIQIALLYGAVIYWEQGLLTIGDFVLIQAYLLTTFGRLMGINWQLRRFYDAFADAGEMVHILNTPHEIKDATDAKDIHVTQGKIAFTNVDFNFASRPVLEHFSLTVQPHQKIALVGPSGAGKSTITKLLLRFFDLPAGKANAKGGSIEIDGQNIAHVTQESLRNAIAFVPQEPVLFHRTLIENIRYGRRDATDDEVIAAAKKAHCHEFISSLQDGYNTYVGERGIKLSGGERQRVAIARAILKNAPILVLDEATSSLDSESEALIQDALQVLMQDKTVIVIAHRLSTIMKMDRIVVLEGGTIVADGTHQELLGRGGLYHKLWSIQAGGFLVDDQEANII